MIIRNGESIVPQVSIGLTVFDSERYLGETIESLLAQTYEDFELIISDNASTDRTREIALDYVASDKRVRYVRNRINVGLAGNFNQAFDFLRGSSSSGPHTTTSAEGTSSGAVSRFSSVIPASCSRMRGPWASTSTGESRSRMPLGRM